MREKKRGKRLLALLLACTLLVTSIPVQASPEHTPETSEGLEVQTGMEDPADPEPVLQNLEGTVVLTEGGAVLEGIPDIWIRFYEQETFDPQSRENEAVAEVITEPDGSFELPELPEGVYRVAFQFLDPEQKAEDYQVIQPEEENGEEPEYQFAFPEEEEKEVLDCFAYIESYVVEEGSISRQESFEQMDLFTDYEALQKQREREEQELERERQLQKAVLDIKKKFGKNALLKGMNLEEGAMTIERNHQIGGHKA